MTDNVDHPAHYTSYNGLEIIDLTEQMNFNRGNAVKYIARAGIKNPAAEIEDLEKAVWYVNREIHRLKEIANSNKLKTEELYKAGLQAMVEYKKENPPAVLEEKLDKSLEINPNSPVSSVTKQVYTKTGKISMIYNILREFNIPDASAIEVCALIRAAAHKHRKVNADLFGSPDTIVAYRVCQANMSLIKTFNGGNEIPINAQTDWFLVSNDGKYVNCLTDRMFNERFVIIATLDMARDQYIVERKK